MAFDASGTFTRLRGKDSWKGDSTAGTKIQSDLHDDNDNDIAAGLSECLNRNGRGSPIVDMPWGGKKITNLGTPTEPGDAASKTYVDTMPGWPKSKNIEGADLDGRLNFTAPSGVNGITWTYAEVSWVARKGKAGETPDRLVMNNSVAPSTTSNAGDVLVIDDAGRINNSGVLSHNLSFEGANRRTISPGIGTQLTYTNGALTLASNDVATITNPYVAATLRNFTTIQNSVGSTFVTLDKSASGKYNRISATMAGKARWVMDLGNATAESGGTTGRVGSDFYLYSYNNDGAVPFAEFSINRSTHTATFGGNVVVSQNFDSSSTTCILSATNGGQILFRPNGPTSATEQVVIDTSGNLNVSTSSGVIGGKGYRCRTQATTGGYGANYFNFFWDGTYVKSYIDNSLVGNIMWQASDYRIKRDIQPLPSMWDKVKSLSPIAWKQQAFGIYEDNDAPRWGFVAHELQDRLGKHAASGEKDGPDVQTIDLMAVVTGLTKALQEAMARIEALEAAA